MLSFWLPSSNMKIHMETQTSLGISFATPKLLMVRRGARQDALERENAIHGNVKC